MPRFVRLLRWHDDWVSAVNPPPRYLTETTSFYPKLISKRLQLMRICWFSPVYCFFLLTYRLITTGWVWEAVIWALEIGAPQPFIHLIRLNNKKLCGALIQIVMCWILKHDTFNQKKIKTLLFDKIRQICSLIRRYQVSSLSGNLEKMFFTIKCLVVSMLEASFSPRILVSNIQFSWKSLILIKL